MSHFSKTNICNLGGFASNPFKYNNSQINHFAAILSKKNECTWRAFFSIHCCLI